MYFKTSKVNIIGVSNVVQFIKTKLPSAPFHPFHLERVRNDRLVKWGTSFVEMLLRTWCNKNVITKDPALASEEHGVSVTSLSKSSCLLPACFSPLASSTTPTSCLNPPPTCLHSPPRPSRPHNGGRGEEGGHGGVEHRLVRLHLLTRQASRLHFLCIKLQAQNIGNTLLDLIKLSNMFMD